MVAEKPKIDLKARLGRKSGVPDALPQGAFSPQGVGPGPSGLPPGMQVPGAQPSAAPGPQSFAPPMGQPQQPGFPQQGLPQPSFQQSGFPGGHVPQQPRPGGPVGGPQGFPGPRPPVGGSSIPAPPGFGPKAQQAAAQAAAPVVHAAPAPAPIRPQEIRLEVGEEVVAARKAGRSKILILVLGVAIAAGAGGFGVGGLSEANKGAEAAVIGAKALVGEVEAANAKAKEMEELFRSAAAALKGGKFPTEQVEKLGSIDIPFDGSNLMNKGIGRFNQTASTLLFRYATAVANAEDQKDKLRRLFGGTKSAWEAGQAQKAKPSVHFGVTVASGSNGPIASLTPIKSFALGEKWPSDVEVGEGKKKSRYDGGDPAKSDAGVIPVDPATEANMCPDNMNVRLMGALLDAARDLAGDQTPGQEHPGLVDSGNKLIDQLKKIGAAPPGAPGAPAAP